MTALADGLPVSTGALVAAEGSMRAKVAAAVSAAVAHVSPAQRDRAIAEATKQVRESLMLTNLALMELGYDLSQLGRRAIPVDRTLSATIQGGEG